MSRIFINFSNHPKVKWSNVQIEAAEEFGDIVDVQFPNVSPYATEQDVQELSQKCLKEILQFNPYAVMCQGEYSLTYNITCELRKRNIPVVVTTTERVVSEYINQEGTTIKKIKYNFIKFRQLF